MQRVEMEEATAAAIPSRARWRFAACLLLAGQVLYIAVTRLHAGGDANNHPAIFAIYAASSIWTAVHVGQFVSMAVLLVGLLALFTAFEAGLGSAKWLRWSGIAVTASALALYGALQAVDGVALKQAVDTWMSASEAEKPARFAAAETVRWLEWGMRSYFDFAMGLALLLCGGAAWVAGVSRMVGLLIASSGLAYLAQGWIAGTEGFSQSQSNAIVASWALSLVWMIWLVIARGNRKVAD